MPVRIFKVERYPTTERPALVRAALNYCRALRTQPKIRSARFFWADPSNTIAFLIEGEPGCFDSSPEPNPELSNALWSLFDLGSSRGMEVWNEPGPAAQIWERAGRSTESA